MSLSFAALVLANLAWGQERITLQQENRAGGVSGLALSADGKTLVTANADGGVRVWNPLTGKLEASWPSSTGLAHVRLALTPDGAKLLARQGNTTRLLERATQKELASFDDMNAAAITPDGNFLVLTNPSGLVRVVGLKPGAESFVLHASTPRVLCVGFAPDGKWLAAGMQDKQLKLWALDTGKVQVLAADLKSNVVMVGFTADSRTVYARGSAGDVTLWDVATGADRTPPEWADLFAVNSVAAVSKDGNFLAAATADGAVKVWDLATGKERLTIPKAKGPLTNTHFSPDGKRLLTVTAGARTASIWDLEAPQTPVILPNAARAVFVRDGKDVAFWQANGFQSYDAATGKETSQYDLPPNTTVLGASLDGKYLAAWSFTQTMVWDTISGKPLPLADGNVTASAFSSDGKTLALHTYRAGTKLWDLATGTANLLPLGPVALLAFSPDSKKLVVGSPDGGLTLRDASSGTTTRTLQPSFGITCLACSADSMRLAVGDQTGAIKIWDLPTRKEQILSAGAGDPLIGLLLSPDGKRLISQDRFGNVNQWDLPAAKPHAIVKHALKVAVFGPALALASDGKAGAVGQPDGSLHLWDTDTKKPKAVFRAHTGVIMNIVFAPDGKSVATTGMDGMVKVWDADVGSSAAAGAPLKELNRLNSTFTQTPPAFTPDGRRLVIGAANGLLRIWDFADNQATRDLQRPTNPIAHMSFTPDAKTLVASNVNGTISLWDIETGREQLLRELPPFGQANPLTALRGSRMAVGRGDGYLGVWGFNGVPQHFLQKPFSPIGHAKFSPDGHTLALVRNDATITLWDVAKNQPRVILVGHKARPFSVHFSADSQTLASFADNDMVPIWNVSTGAMIGNYKMGRNAAYDADSRRLAMGLADGKVELWDTKTGKALPSIQAEKVAIRNVELGKGGAILFTHTFQGTVKLWNVADRRLLAAIPNARDVFSPNFQSLAIPAGDLVRLWDLSAGKEVPPLVPDGGAVGEVHFSPDGQVVASLVAGKLKVQEVNTGKILLSLSATLPAFNAAERMLAVRENAQSVSVWNLTTGKRVRTIDTGTRAITALALADDGRTLMARTQDGPCFLWNTDSGEERPIAQKDVVNAWLAPGNRALLTQHKDNIYKILDLAAGKELAVVQKKAPMGVSAVAIAPDGKKLASGSMTGAVSLWDLETGEELASRAWPGQGLVSELAFAPDGNLLTAKFAFGHVKVWNLADHSEAASFANFTGQTVVSHDGKLVAAIGKDFASVQIWDLAANKELVSIKGSLSAMQFAPDGKTLVGHDHVNLRFIDVATGKERASLPTPRNTMLQSYSFTPGGRILGVSYSNGVIKLIDVAAGEERASFAVASETRYEQPHYTLAFAPDGNSLALASRNGLLKIWQTDLGKARVSLKGHTGAIAALAADPRNDRIVTGSFDHTVRLWDGRTAKELAVFREHKGMVLAVALSPDGKLVASAGADHTVSLRPVPDGDEIKQFVGHKGGVRCVAVTRDGKWALSASGSAAGDRTLRLWDMATGKEVHKFVGHTDQVWCVAVSGDSKRAASAGADRTIIVWDLETRKEVGRLEGHTNTVQSVVFSPDGRRLLSTGFDKTVRLWDIETTRELGVVKTLGIHAVEFLPDGKQALFQSTGGAIYQADFATKKLKRRFVGHAGAVYWLALSPDGRTLLSTGEDYTLRLWDVESGQQIRALQAPAAYSYCAIFVDDGRKVLSGHMDGAMKLWDVSTGVEVHTFRGHKGHVHSLAATRDGRQVLSGGGDGILRLWDLTNTSRALKGHTDAVWAVAFSPDGKWLATGSSDRTIKIWDLATGREVKTLTGHARDVFALAFTRDSQALISGDGSLEQPGIPGAIKLWDVAAGKEVASITPHRGAIRCLAVSPDGLHLATGGADRQLLLWDLAPLRERPADASPRAVLLGHSLPLTSLAFDADGKRLVSVSGDPQNPADAGEVRLWQVDTARPLPPLMGHRCGVTSAVFAPDGVTLITGGFDETTRLWDLAPFRKRPPADAPR
jgi:WD40 repeat protein